MIAIIYLIHNRLTDDNYVGHTTKDFQRRIDQHRRMLEKSSHHSRSMQGAWLMYGGDVFDFYEIESCEIVVRLEREQYWIDKLRPSYNTAPVTGSVLGLRWKNSQETIDKRRASRALTMEQTRIKLSIARRNTTAEAEKRRSDAYKAACRTPEHRAKMSEFAKKRPFDVVKMHSPEVVAKRVASLRRTIESRRLAK